MMMMVVVITTAGCILEIAHKYPATVGRAAKVCYECTTVAALKWFSCAMVAAVRSDYERTHTKTSTSFFFVGIMSASELGNEPVNSERGCWRDDDDLFLDPCPRLPWAIGRVMEVRDTLFSKRNGETANDGVNGALLLMGEHALHHLGTVEDNNGRTTLYTYTID
jgi:hypothetical protein